MDRVGVGPLLPDLVEPVVRFGVVGRARERRLLSLEQISPREFATDRHRTVDDRPYGGGPSGARADGPGAAVRSGVRTRVGGGARIAAGFGPLRRSRRAADRRGAV